MGKGKKKGKGKGKPKGVDLKAADCKGKSLMEHMWDELGTIVERLMSGDGAADDGKDPGRAEGIAWCISLFSQPYYPDLDSVRAEAMRRYYTAEGEEIPAEYV